MLGKEGYLVKIADGGAFPVVSLPAAITDNAFFLIVDAKAGLIDTIIDVEPTYPNQSVRIKAKGTGSAGAIVVLADPATPADAGKVIANPGTSEGVTQIGIAYEDWTDGQLLKVYPFPQRLGASGTTALAGATVLGSGIHVWAGGAAATDAIAVAGLLTTDVVLITLHTATATELIKSAAAAANQINVVMTANAADTTTKLNWVALRP